MKAYFAPISVRVSEALHFHMHLSNIEMLVCWQNTTNLIRRKDIVEYIEDPLYNYIHIFHFNIIVLKCHCININNKAHSNKRINNKSFPS